MQWWAQGRGKADKEGRVEGWGNLGEGEWGMGVEGWGNLGEGEWGMGVEGWGILGEGEWGREVEGWGILGEGEWGWEVEGWGNLGEGGLGREVEGWGNLGVEGWGIRGEVELDMEGEGWGRMVEQLDTLEGVEVGTNLSISTDHKHHSKAFHTRLRLVHNTEKGRGHKDHTAHRDHKGSPGWDMGTQVL